MNKSESKYFNTAEKMDRAFLEILEKKDFAFITVKEICQKAGVNRSTFYLHYETVDDLLKESVEYMSRRFSSYLKKDREDLSHALNEGRLEELNFITPEYLGPYLNYIKENKSLFCAALKNSKTLRLEESFEKMFQYVFKPIFAHYHVSEPKSRYLIAYYIHGLIAIVNEWLKNNCQTEISEIILIMQECVGAQNRK